MWLSIELSWQDGSNERSQYIFFIEKYGKLSLNYPPIPYLSGALLGVSSQNLLWLLFNNNCKRPLKSGTTTYVYFFSPTILEGRRGITDKFTTTPLHLCLFSAVLVELLLSASFSFSFSFHCALQDCLSVGLSLLNQKTGLAKTILQDTVKGKPWNYAYYCLINRVLRPF